MFVTYTANTVSLITGFGAIGKPVKVRINFGLVIFRAAKHKSQQQF
ncbi:hypothetical protein LHGZ1_3393 [Laribacter hongkongensis]|uniref:Uncharacterized protein n=1 Tax=Laribacter hongkongensis TaxID=168471 RepID=A0A248LP69_9NEIS|nr:hypothetical protein LHGZ1_3393 [Laribacter hongkongensis]